MKDAHMVDENELKELRTELQWFERSVLKKRILGHLDRMEKQLADVMRLDIKSLSSADLATQVAYSQAAVTNLRILRNYFNTLEVRVNGALEGRTSEDNGKGS